MTSSEPILRSRALSIHHRKAHFRHGQESDLIFKVFNPGKYPGVLFTIQNRELVLTLQAKNMQHDPCSPIHELINLLSQFFLTNQSNWCVCVYTLPVKSFRSVRFRMFLNEVSLLLTKAALFD